jgi:hypothetical protein
MAQYMTYDTTVDSDIWYFEGVFKMPKAISAQAAISWGLAASGGLC